MLKSRILNLSDYIDQMGLIDKNLSHIAGKIMKVCEFIQCFDLGF